jgi:hypothetical protein
MLPFQTLQLGVMASRLRRRGSAFSTNRIATAVRLGAAITGFSRLPYNPACPIARLAEAATYFCCTDTLMPQV